MATLDCGQVDVHIEDARTGREKLLEGFSHAEMAAV
jgi:hypothetical protein